MALEIKEDWNNDQRQSNADHADDSKEKAITS